MTSYRITGPLPESADPILLVGLDGWVNAGRAATSAAEFLAGEGPVVVSWDPDALFDYRASRPTLTFEQGVLADVEFPELVLHRRRLGGRDLLVLTGTEPNWGWRRLAGEVAELAAGLGVVRYVSLGGIPWAVPHSRPVTMITTATDPSGMADGDERPEGSLRVPGSATSVIEGEVARRGIPTMGLWARVPHYVGTAFVPAAHALVEAVLARTGLELDTSSLAASASEQRAEIDAIAASRPDVQALVQRLEGMVDDRPPVSGEDLAAEIERFLRTRDDGPFGDER